MQIEQSLKEITAKIQEMSDEQIEDTLEIINIQIEGIQNNTKLKNKMEGMINSLSNLYNVVLSEKYKRQIK
jgi:hypothetical protein